TGSHAFAETGSYGVVVSITDSGGAAAQATTSAKVTSAPLSGSAVSVSATAGQSFTGPVATFTDANPFGQVGDFTATITWGDGSPASTGTVVVNPNGPGFQVLATHTYAKAGTFNFFV